jgi:dihydrolipoamide dehydrogenase
VGLKFSSLKDYDHLIGKSRLNSGRAIILSQEGIIRVYANSFNGKLLGAEMMAPHEEHLVHLLAIQQKMTVFEELRVPFYHPVMEEGLRSALRSIVKQIKRGRSYFDLAPLASRDR